ncbi:MAG: hypothetical protein WCB44_25675 [Stellaceae bacterium]
MVVPVPHQGQLPVPAGMLVPKVIRSPLLTVAATFFDNVMVVLPVVIETVVPEEIALGFVVSWTVRPVTADVITPFGNVRVLPDVVAELVGVPKSVTTAHGDPVLNSVAAVMLVFNDSVLVVVAALVVFTTPEYPPPPEPHCAGI